VWVSPARRSVSGGGDGGSEGSVGGKETDDFMKGDETFGNERFKKG